ncbi:hypothetical protein Tco_0814675 [Tanacetum coccineum]
MPASPEYLSSLARASLAEVSSLSSFPYYPAMSKNYMKTRVSTLSKDDLSDLVKTFHIPVDLHPRLPDPALTMDRLPDDAIGLNKVVSFEVVCRDLGIVPTVTLFRVFQVQCKQGYWAIPDHLTCRHSHSCVSDDLPIYGYDRNDVGRLCARAIRLRGMREEVLVRSGLIFVWLNKKCDPVFRKKADDSGKLGRRLYDLHTIVPTAEGAPIPVPTPDENRPSKKRKLGKRASEVGSSAPKVEQVEGLDDAFDFWVDLENSLDKTNSTPARAVSAPTSYLGKRLGPPLSLSFVVVSEPLQIGGSVNASTSGHDFAQKGFATGSFAGKPRAEDVRRCLDPLDTLARSALARDSEYDQIPEDDFATASRGKEIDLTLFPLAPGPYEGLDHTITHAELRRTESLLPLELVNSVSVLSALLVLHGTELNYHYSNLVNHKSRTQEKLYRKTKYVKELRSEVTTLDEKLEKVQGDCSVLNQENRELHSQNDALFEEVNRLQSQLTNAKDIPTGLSDELAWTDVKLADYALFVRDLRNERLLSSNEFNAALAHAVSLRIAFGFEKGLRMGRTDAEYEAATRNVSNFSISVGAEFNKALDSFPSIQFPFLGKVASAAESPLSKVTQIMPEKFVRSVGYVSNVVVAVSGVPNQAPVDQASDDSPFVS